MVVGGEEGLGANMLVDILNYCLGQGHPIVSSGSTANLIKED